MSGSDPKIDLFSTPNPGLGLDRNLKVAKRVFSITSVVVLSSQKGGN